MKRVQNISARLVTIEGNDLAPGDECDVSEETYAKIRDKSEIFGLPGTLKAGENGRKRPPPLPESPDAPKQYDMSEFLKLKGDDAINAAGGLKDAEQIRAWLASEKRVTVRAVLTERLAEIDPSV